MSRLPAATPLTVSVLPDTETVATELASELAATVCVSPLSPVCVSPLSPSVTLAVRVPVDSRATVKAEIGPNTGRLFGTVAANVTAADVAFDAPLLSSALTVIVASPRETAFSVSVLPSTITVATSASLDLAVTVCASPTSPSATVTPAVTPTVPVPGARGNVTSEMESTSGRLFGTAAVNVTAADVAFDAPLLSVALTVIVASPRETAFSVSVLPSTVTVATPLSLEVAVTVCVSPLSLSVTLAVRVPVDPRDTVKSEIGPTTGRLFGAANVTVTASDQRLHSTLHARAR